MLTPIHKQPTSLTGGGGGGRALGGLLASSAASAASACACSRGALLGRSSTRSLKGPNLHQFRIACR